MSIGQNIQSPSNAANNAEVDQFNHLNVNRPTNVLEAGYDAISGVLTDGTGGIAAFGTWTVASGSGTLTLTLGGTQVSTTWASSDTLSAAAMALACTQNVTLAPIFWFSNTAGVVNIVCKQGGASGNSYTLAGTGSGVTVSGSYLLGGVSPPVALQSLMARKIDASARGRMKSAVDSLLFYQDFAGTTIDTGVWSYATVNNVAAQASGWFDTNSTGLVAAANGCSLVSRKCFTLHSSAAALRIDFRAIWPTGYGEGQLFELGLAAQNTALGTVPASTTTALDGAYFRINNGGQIEAVLATYGVIWSSTQATEQHVQLGFAPLPNVAYEFSIVVNISEVLYYVNQTLFAVIPLAPASFATLIGTGMSTFFRNNNTAAVTAVNGQAGTMKISDASVTLWDTPAGRPYHHALAGMGGSAIQTQTGVTTTFNQAAPTWLANWATNAAPASATLSNTAPSYTELGGQCQWVTVNGAETDAAIFGYQVPVGSVARPGKTLYITGIRIQSITMTATNSNYSAIQWSIGVGSYGASGASLANTEGAGTKAPRILPLGYTTAIASNGFGGGAVGATWALPIEVIFQSPLVANSGEYVHIIAKNVIGVASTSVARSVVMINGYFE